MHGIIKQSLVTTAITLSLVTAASAGEVEVLYY
jgi:hypothetical protein